MMHQSIPAAPSPPPRRATADQLLALSVPGVGHLCCLGAGHLPTPGPLPSFSHARCFLSEKKITQMISLGKKADWLICHGQEKIEEVVKACS